MAGLACAVVFILAVISIAVIVLLTKYFGIFGFVISACIIVAAWIWVLNSKPEDV